MTQRKRSRMKRAGMQSNGSEYLRNFIGKGMGPPSLFLSPANKCPRQNAQKGSSFFGDCGRFFSLTLPGKNGTFNEINAVMKTSTCYHLSARELPVGARQ